VVILLVSINVLTLDQAFFPFPEQQSGVWGGVSPPHWEWGPERAVKILKFSSWKCYILVHFYALLNKI